MKGKKAFFSFTLSLGVHIHSQVPARCEMRKEGVNRRGEEAGSASGGCEAGQRLSEAGERGVLAFSFPASVSVVFCFGENFSAPPTLDGSQLSVTQCCTVWLYFIP